MRSATASVGDVSPRSTCDSMGAETPERADRSRSERPSPSRRVRTRTPRLRAEPGTDAVATRVRYHVRS